MSWLKRRLQKWLEIDTTLGKPGFEAIYHKGKPVYPADDPHVGELYTNTTGTVGILTEDMFEKAIKKGYES